MLVGASEPVLLGAVPEGLPGAELPEVLRPLGVVVLPEVGAAPEVDPDVSVGASREVVGVLRVVVGCVAVGCVGWLVGGPVVGCVVVGWVVVGCVVVGWVVVGWVVVGWVVVGWVVVGWLVVGRVVVGSADEVGAVPGLLVAEVGGGGSDGRPGGRVELTADVPVLDSVLDWVPGWAELVSTAGTPAGPPVPLGEFGELTVTSGADSSPDWSPIENAATAAKPVAITMPAPASTASRFVRASDSSCCIGSIASCSLISAGRVCSARASARREQP